MPQACDLGNTIVEEVSGVHIDRISLHHMDVAKGLEALRLLVEVGTIAGHRCIPVLEDDIATQLLYTWL